MRVSEEVLAVLSESVECDDANKAAVIVRELDRNLYVKVNKVLTAVGGKWNRRAKAHLFEMPPTLLLDRVMVTGEVQTHQDIGFFPTPVELARQLADMAGVRSGDRCLEPSAGTGRIVDVMCARGAKVTAIERVERMRQQLIASGRCAVAPYDDFMDVDGNASFRGRFDRVVMNPPFVKVGRGDQLDHVRLAYSLLRPKGVLVSVLPRSVEFRCDRRHSAFRDWALDECGGQLERLPDGAFVESGTRVATNTLRLGRR